MQEIPALIFRDTCADEVVVEPIITCEFWVEHRDKVVTLAKGNDCALT